MRLPRDLSGEEVARLLDRHYGYRTKRTRGSHMTVAAETPGGTRHSVTVPKHRSVSLGRWTPSWETSPRPSAWRRPKCGRRSSVDPDHAAVRLTLTERCWTLQLR